jgi:acyl-CoA synthetase (AMP-forming)/AMP-acid ligase II
VYVSACERPNAVPTVIHLDKAALQNGQAIITKKGNNTKPFVGNGVVQRPSLGIYSIIVDVEGADSYQLCAAGQVGEIWVTSPSKSRGYWNADEINRDR